MNLLITTQAVDKEDPILGFFHGWLLALSKQYDHIHVVCLKEGTHTLPSNVIVHSLGKELGENRFKYVARFFMYIWRLRKEYDAIFSHMNPHYIVLAGWFWTLMKKPMYLWRNHAQMNIKTRVAAFFARNVFYTSPYACTKRFSHSVQMPVGIDTNAFYPQEGVQRKERSILFLGRVSGVKRPELFVEASKLLNDFEIAFYGDEPSGEGVYLAKLREIAEGNVSFYPAVPNYETPHVYSAYDIYVNLTPEGSMDKTILEAAACGALILVSNKSFSGVVPPPCLLRGDSKEEIASQIQELSTMSRAQKDEYRIQLQRMVMNTHSLQALVTKLVKHISV